MTAQEIRVEIERITAAVKRHEWTPEVFERTEAILYYQEASCIFGMKTS